MNHAYLRSPFLPPLPTTLEELDTLDALREEKLDLRNDAAIRVRELVRRASTLRDWEVQTLEEEERKFLRLSREIDALTAAILRAGGVPR